MNHETPDDAVDPAIGYAVVGRLHCGGFVPVTYPERVRGVSFAELWIFGEPSSVRDMELEKNLEPCLASMTQSQVHRIMPGVRHCDYVGINSLMPVEWNDWFWATIAEDCPFEIDGQHDHSLVEAYRIKDHCEDLLRDAIDDGKVVRALPIEPTR